MRGEFEITCPERYALCWLRADFQHRAEPFEAEDK
jgi:hypothetical protein